MSKPFEIGICMAGAVSAGAYTAGVMDYLIEALEAWEQKKGESGVPTHEVIIKVIGGASAGGMTGIVAASALNNSIVPVKEADPNDLLKEYPENKFYNSWVDLVDKDMFPLMLKNDDIERGKIYSLLNSQFIKDIGEKSLKVNKDGFIQRKYIEKHLKVFTTLTNLEGFRYNTSFKGEIANQNYDLSHHADYVAFILNKIEDEYDDDGWIPLDFFKDVNIDIALDAAMSTGAFPIGLQSRTITRKKKYVEELKWNKDLFEKFPIKQDPYTALIIDGGTINNEPFEQVKDLIEGGHSDENIFKGTTLMIDPFPNYADTFKIEENGLLSIIKKTLSAMVGHLRSKPELIKKEIDENDVSQFQIAPIRYENKKKIEGKWAIACGFFGGFGGFIHKEFRVHDYFLGRANCEKFLREYFTVNPDTTNSIFKEGYANVGTDMYISEKGKRQIIPIFTEKKDDMYMPEFENGGIWPTRTEADIDRFKNDLKKRSGKIIMNFSKYNFKTRILLGIGNWVLLKRKLAKTVIKTIKSDMVEHGLLEGNKNGIKS